MAQSGERHADVKSLRGFGGGTMLEVVENYNTDTFRAVYTVRFAGFVFVLHGFMKKSSVGNKTPKNEMDVVKTRLQAAKRMYEDYRDKKEAEQKQRTQPPQMPQRVGKRKKR